MKIIFFLLCFFILESNLSAQDINSGNAGTSSVVSNGEWIYTTTDMPYHVDVPFFTRMNPTSTSVSYKEFYGMSMYNLYFASNFDLYGTIDLLKIDTEKLSITKDGVYSKSPYVRVRALNEEESWNTRYKDKDGNEKQETQVPLAFDTEAQAQKFIDELKICIKLSELTRRTIYRIDLQNEKNVEANAKKCVAFVEECEKLIAGKKYTLFDIILDSKKYNAYEAGIKPFVEYDATFKMFVYKDFSPESGQKIYVNLDKMKKLRSKALTKYKPFIDNYYPKSGVRDKCEAMKSYYTLTMKGGYLDLLPATQAEFDAKNVQNRKDLKKLEGEKQQEKKKIETTNAADASGNSPLMNAIKAKDLEKVKSLIKNNADVTYKNAKTNTSVLKYALEIRDFAIIKELMQTKNIKEELEYSGIAKSKVYHNELMYVIEKNDAELYKLFKNTVFKQVKDDYTDKDGNYPCMIAYNLGNFEKAWLIYLFSGDNNEEKQRKKDGYTFLMLAIEKNDTPAATKLAGVTSEGLNIMNNEGYTALMMAAERGQKEVVEAILARIVRTTNSSGESTTGNYDPNFVSDKGKMKGKKAIDVAKNKEIKNMLKQAAK